MSNEVTIKITSCHQCPEFHPRFWEWFNPLNYPMRFWSASGYCAEGNFYIPNAMYGTIPQMCPYLEMGDEE